MESFQDFSDETEEESTRKLHTANSRNWSFKAKICAAKMTNNILNTKTNENILIQVAFSVWLGSIWHFPYLCHRNGGGPFILVYFVMLLLLGIPLMYMEVVIGHWLQVDNIRVWKQLVSWLGGLGYANILVSILVSLCNSVIISWSLFYLCNSFNHPLPWDHCPMVKHQLPGFPPDFSCLWTVPHQYFWYHTTLQVSDHIEDGIEVPVLHLTLGLFAVWIFLFLIMIAGIKTSMSILTFLIFLPYILLFCLFIRSLFLEGAGASLKRLVTTEVSTLSSLDLWHQAGSQVLYSLGLGMGTIITFSSYKTRGDNCVKMASFVALINLIAKGVLPQEAKPPESILLKPPLDYLDWISHLPKYLQHKGIHLSPSCSIMEQKEKFMEGPGLAFAAFSQAVSLLPGTPFWAITFFLTLAIVKLSTMIRIVESIAFPLQNATSFFMKHPRLVPVFVCLGGFLGSLIFTSRSGSYVVSLFDDYLVPMILLIIVLAQNVTLAWIYGVGGNFQEMLSKLDRLLWPTFLFLCSYVTPPGLLALLSFIFMHLYRKGAPYYISWNSSVVRQPPPCHPSTPGIPSLSSPGIVPIMPSRPLPWRDGRRNQPDCSQAGPRVLFLPEKWGTILVWSEWASQNFPGSNLERDRALSSPCSHHQVSQWCGSVQGCPQNGDEIDQ
uniref:Transporter n=1 Tax=Castor canadensis TaxID=51338 RepID=A0A8C0XST5_CASCN